MARTATNRGKSAKQAKPTKTATKAAVAKVPAAKLSPGKAVAAKAAPPKAPVVKMPAPKPAGRKAPVKRGIGRPAAGGNSVGREKLLKTACDLLKVTPPAKLTRFMVAQKAGVDPSLIRYYFRDRISMLAAAAERLAEQYSERLEAVKKESPGSSLHEQIAMAVGLEVSFAHFRRLLLDELIGAGSGAAKAAAAQIAKRGVENYRDVLLAGGKADDETAALLFITVIAVSCYSSTARSLYESATGQKISQAAMVEKYGNFVAGLLASGLSGGYAAEPVAKRGRKKPE